MSCAVLPLPRRSLPFARCLAAIALLGIQSSLVRADDPPKPPLPGHSAHGEVFNEGPRQAAWLMGGTGRVSLPVSTNNPTAQQFFNQGVGQLHGFWYYEAERSFRQVAALDADCAMAYWGMAMANFNNAQRAKPFLAKALERTAKASPREREWIEALDEYFNGRQSDNALRRRELIEDWEDIYNHYPDELEAKAFVLWQLWDNNDRGAPIESRLGAQALISEVLAVEPLHPVHHYRIHLGDLTGAHRADTFRSAALCGPAAPSIAHMWHMPGHTYSDSRRYADGAWQQEAALRVDNAYLMRARMLPDETYLFVHNRDWLIDNLDFVGRVAQALDVCRHTIELPRHPKFGQATAAEGLRRMMRVMSDWELWDELVALERDAELCEPTDDPARQVERLRAFGRAHLHLGHFEQGLAYVGQLETWETQLRQEQQAAGDKTAAQARSENKPEDQINQARDGARGPFDGRLKLLVDARTELQGCAELFADAPAAAELLAKVSDVSPELLSRAYLRAGNAAKAEELSRETEHKLFKMANRVDLLFHSGRTDEARKLFEELRPLASGADLELPRFQRLRPAVESWTLPVDWRLPAPVPADIGERPALDQLGPLRWQASPAPEWKLPNLQGELVSLADYRGQPLVVIFYLGFGCVHCVEQLNAFAPLVDQYRQAGISLLAISTDTVEGMRESAAAGQGLPITILSDAGLGTFQAYRAFDDFEHKPLHGAFLIDGAGLVRWQDVGFAPFTNPQFLLVEARRLLRQGGAGAAKPGND